MREPSERLNNSERLEQWIGVQTAGCQVVIEFGAMFGEHLAQVHPGVQRRIGIELWEPYLTHQRCLDGACPGREMVHGDMRRFEELIDLDRDCWDCALFVDSLEHLTRADAVDLMRRVMSSFRCVLLFVPEGEHPQDRDATGLGADELQTHRSSWREAEVRALGFDDVCVVPDFFIDDPDHAVDKAPGAIFAVWRRKED